MTEREVRSLPMVALRGMTVLPEMVTHFDVSRERSIEAIKEAMQEDGQKIFLTAQLDIEVEEPSAQDLCQVGTIASHPAGDQAAQEPACVCLSPARKRASINTVEFETPYMRANVTVPAGHGGGAFSLPGRGSGPDRPGGHGKRHEGDLRGVRLPPPEVPPRTWQNRCRSTRILRRW